MCVAADVLSLFVCARIFIPCFHSEASHPPLLQGDAAFKAVYHIINNQLLGFDCTHLDEELNTALVKVF